MLETATSRVAGTDVACRSREVAHVVVSRAAAACRADVDPGGLEDDRGYKRASDTGTFSYACHACAVAVDTELGHGRDPRLCRRRRRRPLVNPMVVDGQVFGGTAQGIGTALYEEMPFDSAGAAARVHARRLSAARRDRSAGDSHRAHGNALAATPRSGRKASAKAARSRRPRRSPTRSTMRSRRSGRRDHRDADDAAPVACRASPRRVSTSRRRVGRMTSPHESRRLRLRETGRHRASGRLAR